MVSYLQLIFQNQSVEKIDLFNNINGSLRNILQEKSRTVINLNEDKNGDETDDGSENADLEKKIVEAEDLTNKLKNVQMVKVKVVQADSNAGDAIDACLGAVCVVIPRLCHEVVVQVPMNTSR